MFSNILIGAAGFPVADLGDEISQSLRSRGPGTGRLERTPSSAGNRQTYTISFWIKHDPTNSRSIYAAERFQANTASGRFGGNAGAHDPATNITWNVGAIRFRDPSAWYHWVFVGDTTNATEADRIRFYINGVRITISGTNLISQNYNTGWNAAVTTTIFDYADTSDAGGSNLDGYLAEFYNIDGQALDPTEFGRYQEDGVWVPKNYTGTYGTNGFHLDFADGSNPGNDVSGNNNDFTASGFDTADVALYSAFEAGSGTTYESTASNRTSTLINAGSAFDGNTAGGTQVDEAGGGFWYLTYTINSVSGLRILMTGQTAQIAETRVNGSVATTSVSGNYIVITSPPSTVTEVAIRRNTANTQVYQVEVDTGSGFVALLDNTDNDVDYNDTPTSNYATFNTVHTDTAGGATLEEGNLFLSATGGATRYVDARSTIPASECNCYVEMYVRTKSGSNALIGIGVGDHESRISLGTGAYVCYRQNGGIIEYPGNTTLGTESSYDAGDVIGMTVNSTQVAFYKNGTLEGTYNHGLTGDFFVIGMAYDNGHNSEVEFNFGQRNFIYTIPTGFSALQTNNLPEPTIKNGKDHFNILTWTGTGTTNALTGLGFQPDLVWVKKRGDTTESHDLQDSIRGAGERLRTNSPDISRTIAGTIDSFDSDGFTVDDAGTTNESGKTYVAWCWKAGGTAVSNTDGSTTSTVSANTDAGFSIVKYTGTSANATVGHGLNSPPEFIIFKDYTDLNEENWAIWFNGFNVSTGEHLAFNTSGLDTLSTLLNGTAPTSSVIHLGNNVLINDNGEDVIAYCWHSVEGYSKFGSYTGNGSADGSFVYLGFRPAWILRKDIDSTNEWTLIDSTRSPNNPTNETLVPNAADAEDGDFDIDILSNGFKCRTSESAHNRNGGTYVYACFAENPFGGENAPPATAR